MEREAFRQRMQQYKQARENNPQLKYWDWKKYADGGIVDEDPPQNTSERPITNFDPKGDPYNPTYGYNPGAGYVRSVFDLYDAPVIGDALSIYDATQALKNKDWLGAGLAALTVVPFIPTVSNYKKSLNQQLNILKYLKSLPDTDSIKKAALQFKNLDDYIKWLNTMPLADNGNINETENYNFA